AELNEAREKFNELHRKFKEERKEEQEKVKELGGLCIIGTERHESRRIDNQLRGRSGRQGDPGQTQFFISLEDELLRLFGGERMKKMVDKMGLDEDEAIEAGMLSRAIEGAQKKVEGKNFGIRKYVLQYDNVMNKQREIIYDERRKVLFGEDLRDYIMNMMRTIVNAIIDPIVVDSKYPEEWDFEVMNKNLRKITAMYRGKNEYSPQELQAMTEESLREAVISEFESLYEAKETEVGREQMREVERMILLRVVDNLWMDHIDAMDQLKTGIGLRALGQQDPAAAYAKEGFDMFEQMINAIQEDTVRYCYNVTVETKAERRHILKAEKATKSEYVEDETTRAMQGEGQLPEGAQVPDREHKPETYRRDQPKVGRNDPCPCGSGKKYKNCCGRS
ncbi:MAG: SEC-C metal-binding domain-containing protein, partial [Emergencia sp.]|nr:SEC-C metal-binding domain-containing protein [Emergencia sp.]